MPRSLALLALNRYEKTGARCDDVFAWAMARSERTDASRALFAELFLGTIRRRDTLDAIIDAYARLPRARMERSVLWALRLALYQVVFMDRIPAREALAGARALLRGPKRGRAKFVEGILRAVTRNITIQPISGDFTPTRGKLHRDDRVIAFGRPAFPDPNLDPLGYLSATESYPRWLVTRIAEQHGPIRAREILRAGNQAPPLCAWFNPMRTSMGRLKERLGEDGVRTRHAPHEHAVFLDSPGDIARLRAFRDGLVLIQDLTAGNAARALGVQPGDRVLDVCAAPGGKCSAFAFAMGGRGEIVAVDRASGALRRLRENIERLGLESVRVVDGDFLDVDVPIGEKPFTRVFVDAPCSNTGVMARRADLRWRLKPKLLDTLPRRQLALLQRAFEFVAPGGTLAYSTCSVDHAENQEVVRRFLESQPVARQTAQRLTLPRGGECDGGFLALFARKGQLTRE